MNSELMSINGERFYKDPEFVSFLFQKLKMNEDENIIYWIWMKKRMLERMEFNESKKL